MSLRFSSQLQVDNLPDEQITDQFEVIMPELSLDGKNRTGIGGFFGALAGIKYRPIVEEITFGHMNFVTDTRRVRTGWYNVPKDIENYHEVGITMFCSTNMQTQYYLEAWKRLIYNPEGEYYYRGSHYKRNIEVYIYGPAGNGIVGELLSPKCHYTLKGCFPFAQDDFKFKYSNEPERFRILAKFKVDAITKDESVYWKAGLAEAITSPTSLLDHAITNITGQSDTYSMEETYGGKGSWITKGKNIIAQGASSIIKR